MRVNSIEKTPIQNQQNFNGLIKDRTSLHIISKFSKEDTLELKNIEKKLLKTKLWDLKIFGDHKLENLRFEFINKKKPLEVISDRIYPYNRNNNEINYYTIIPNIKQNNNSFNFVGTLKFKTKEKAEQLYNSYLKDFNKSMQKHWILSPIENIKSRLIQLEMLEESSKYTGRHNNKNIVNTESKTKHFIGK